VSERRSPEDAAVLGLARTMVAISLAATAALPVPISVVQLRALTVLSTRTGTNLAAFAAALGLSVSSTGRLCDRLAAGGWVSRAVSPRTRREIALDLTADGRALLAAYDRHRLDELSAALDRLTPQRRAEVVSALHDFAEAARAGAADPDGPGAGGRRLLS
jgi:DNA-binding MarR family transcriptional regulator